VSAAHWISNLAAWSLQAAALVAAGGLAAFAFRLRAPRVRLAYWQALLAICLLLPAVEPWRRAAASNIEISTTAARPVSPGRAPAHFPPWRQALLFVLISGCAGRALWLAFGFRRLRRWRRQARPFSPIPPRLEQLRTALAPRTDFRLSSTASGPVTFGLLRPVVVLPANFGELQPDIQEAVVCHELLHVRRRDWVVTVAEQFIGGALWFHPAIWWLIGQAQLAREQAVDRDAVALTGNRGQYLNALLAMVVDQPELNLAPVALFLRKRHLKNRVALLLQEVTMSKQKLISFCAASCGVLLTAGWLALHAFPLQAAPVPQEAAPSNLLHSVPPKYPAAALVKHIEGQVVLEVHIDAEGHVSDAKVISGAEELRSAALEAILQWHYNPQAMTLPATTQVTMNFTLAKLGAPAAMAPNAPPNLPPFTLKSIEIEGLSTAARDELLGRLTIHVGDTIDGDVMQSVRGTVRAFDEHLSAWANSDSGVVKVVLMPQPAGSAAPAGPRIRVGGNVQQAKLLVKVQPVYPAEAKAQGIEGQVRLQAILGKEGKVENLQVLSGDSLLAAAALDAVRQWQYETTLLNGNPVEVVTEIDVNFTLAK
jgi:TonB family protein